MTAVTETSSTPGVILAAQVSAELAKMGELISDRQVQELWCSGVRFGLQIHQDDDVP